MPSLTAGYREIAHTADWELEVWAKDLPGLLEQAALGMLHLAGARLEDSPPQEARFSVTAPDPESLLVNFLSELLFQMEQTGMGFSDFRIQVQTQPDAVNLACLAEFHARPLLALDKEIKAVTYHRLQVLETLQGLSTRIVFDV